MKSIAELLKKQLCREYGRQISVGIGDSQNIAYTPYEPSSHLAVAVYLNIKYGVGVIWNVEYRRKKGAMIKTFVLNEEWNQLLPTGTHIKDYYKQIGTTVMAPYEKVLAVDFDFLQRYIHKLVDILQIHPDDLNFPKNTSLEKNLKSSEDSLERSRISTSRLSREEDFRDRVLDSYGGQCAICHCSAKQILQAAHIKAVSNGGSDRTDNGICLCANHHLMLDRGLIEIDSTSRKLTNVSDSVKNMAWYSEFVKKYRGELLTRK